MAKRGCAWILAVLLLAGFSGCTVNPAQPTPTASPAMTPTAVTPTPQITSTPAPAQEAELRTVPFSQMLYTRPDGEAFLREANTCMMAFYDCNSAAEQLEVYQRYRALLDDIATMQAIAYIHNNMDYYDEYWAGEYAYCATLTPAMTATLESVASILQKSRFRSELEAVLDPVLFSGNIDAGLEDDSAAMAIVDQENALVNLYDQMLGTAVVEREGEILTLTQATTAGSDALTDWLKANNEPLGQYFCDLVKVRNARAKLMGYPSYISYQYALKGRDYTPEMAQQLRVGAKEQISPLYEKLRATEQCFDPQLTVSLYDAMGFLNDTLPMLSDRFTAPFQHMLNYELYDLMPRTGKRNGAFTSYLYAYDAPFLLMTFQEDNRSLFTLIHEFGHFCDFYTDANRLDRSSTDVTEIFSQGLELLLLPYTDRLFTQEEQQAVARYNLLRALNVYVYQSYWDAFQEEVYALLQEELTVEAVNAIAKRLCKEYNISFGSRYLNEHYWVTLSHNYDTPFYTLTYVTSVDAALQLYLLAQTDEAAAVDTYFTLFDREVSEDFLANLEAAGLESPFAEEHAARLAEALWAQAEVLLNEAEADEANAA